MATLDKIFISGIRSYGIEKSDAQSFDFLTPVTLFLGQNGCGKTTIIEAVKHALTGDFPFSTKTGGQTFVSDPQMYKVTSVKGCIKLAFNDVYQKPATISRTLKLEVLPTKKVKFSSMDATYEYIDENDVKKQLSVRLADCKEMLSMLVGVSDAVLNNVLFCHQEDALWPLSEDGTVKKKFDLIFESTKFDGLVDVLQKEVKMHNAALLNLKKELLILKDIKVKAQYKKDTLVKKEDNMRLLKAESVDLRKQLKPLKERQEKVHALENSILNLHKLKITKEGELKTNRTLQTALKDLIKSEFEGSDAQLDNEIENFHKQVEVRKSELRDVENKIRRHKEKIRDNQSKQQEKQSRLAGLQEKINNYERRIKERNEITSGLMRTFEKSPRNDFKENYDEVVILCGNEQQALETTEIDFLESEAELQKQLEETQDAFMKIKSEVAVKRKELDATMEAKRNTELTLQNLTASDLEFKSYAKKIAQVESEIKTLNASCDEDSALKTIEKNRKKIRDLNELLEELDADLKKFMNNHYVENDIENQRIDISNKEKDIRTMKSKHHKEFVLLFDENIPTQNFETEVDKLQRKHFQELNNMKEKLKEVEKQLSNASADMRLETSQLKIMKTQLNTDKEKIRRLCGSQNFEQKYTEVLERRNKLQNKKGGLSSSQIIYAQFVKEFESKKCCPLCETNFVNNQESLRRAVASTKEQIQRIPERLRTVTNELRECEKLYSELEQLKPVHSKLIELEPKISAAEQNISNISAKITEFQANESRLKHDIASHQKIHDTCTTLLKVVVLIDRHAKDILKTQEKIRELQTTMITIDSSRTKEQTEITVEETKDEIKMLTDQSERFNKKITVTRNRMHELRNKKSELVDAQLNLQKLVQGKPQLIDKQKELEEKEVQLNEEIENMDMALMNANQDVEEAKDRLKRLKADHQSTLGKLKVDLQSHQATLKEINKLQAEISQIASRKHDEECERILEDIEQFKTKLKVLEAECLKLEAQCDKFKDELRDQDSAEQSLQNNRKLRQHRKEEADIKKTVDSITGEIGSQNYQSIENEKNELAKKISEIHSTLLTIEGEMKSLQTNIDDIMMEMKSYTLDPFQMYIKKVCEIRTEKFIIAELRNVMEILANALCKYHREQLLFINLRLRDLWRATYKGNDIEYIQIESGGTEIGKCKRTYTYCIMQKKGDIEMPMRGKCSAGQKVLACLLVRIVLSEHFSSKCGIFALDEPTTNLDKENIRSLSQCIARLVNTRRAQRNFQFLIITHDEEFLDALREVDAIQEYYRVSRNYNGNTVITMESI